jgi:hypothetical protein
MLKITLPKPPEMVQKDKDSKPRRIDVQKSNT